MQFGIFYEHQLPRPWREGDEHRLFKDALEQVELADRLGIDYAWEVEHHFLEEYSHSSAPEVFLAACSQRTKRIRLGHGIVLMPPHYNHPGARRRAHRHARSGERRPRRVGHRRVQLAPRARGLRHRSYRQKRDMWLEAMRETAKMMAHEPVPGLRGQVLLDAASQRRPEAAAEAAPAAVGGVLEPRHHPARRPARHGRAHLRIRRSGARPSTGSRSTTRPSRTSASRSAARSTRTSPW